jgi:endonuclease/exonuclease/phosphatase family metal-dependent hydrolase
LSRWPIVEEQTVALPDPDQRGSGRIVLSTRIAAPGGTLSFFSAHLDSHPAASAARVVQVTSLARLVSRADRSVYPPVVTGDFNAEAQSDEMRLLEGHLTAPVVPGQVLVNAWRYASAGCVEPTWDPTNPHVATTGEPAAVVDHILVGTPSRGGAGRVLAVWRFGSARRRGIWPSDHAGVAARLQAAPT